jgi:hypothetical protein
MDKIEQLTNFDIEQLCQKLNLPLLQICSKDNIIVKPNSKKSCYVINLDKYSGGGTHWVALYISNKNGYYFDSFGEICPKNVINFLKRYKISWDYNKQQIQDLDSTACGYYCIYFLYFMNKNDVGRKNLNNLCFKMLEAYNSDDQSSNDGILQKHIIDIFK